MRLSKTVLKLLGLGRFVDAGDAYYEENKDKADPIQVAKIANTIRYNENIRQQYGKSNKKKNNGGTSNR